MTKVYRVNPEGGATPLKQIRCQNEDEELQSLLERSPELLAGEQIDPENPRRWILIKREMGVPDPTTGAARWSIDFLFMDQDAVLTFVECKRHDDTRSRREIIGQVLDYVANAPRFWTGEELQAAAAATARKAGQSLEDLVKQLRLSGNHTPAELFAEAIEKLQKHQLRIVLFLETAPPELKTLVEFLNLEFSQVEVLLIEAKLYEMDGIRVVAPSLWGYTEQVRVLKQASAVARSTARKRWDEATFFAELAGRLDSEAGQAAVSTLYRDLPKSGFGISWGTGQNATLNVSLPHVTERAIFTVTSEGDLIINFGSLGRSHAEVELRATLLSEMQKEFGWRAPPNFPNCYPRHQNAEWAPQVEKLVSILARQAIKGTLFAIMS